MILGKHTLAETRDLLAVVDYRFQQVEKAFNEAQNKPQDFTNDWNKIIGKWRNERGLIVNDLKKKNCCGLSPKNIPTENEWNKILEYINTQESIWSKHRKNGSIFGGSDAGECDAPFKITYPSQVDEFKKRLGSVFDDTNATVDRCTNIDVTNKAAWKSFYDKWKSFQSKETGIFGSHGEWIETCTYAKTLDGWREKIQTFNCATVGPEKLKGYELPSSAIDFAKWATIGIVVIGGVVVTTMFLPEIKTATRSLRK